MTDQRSMKTKTKSQPQETATVRTIVLGWRLSEALSILRDLDFFRWHTKIL